MPQHKIACLKKEKQEQALLFWLGSFWTSS